MTAWFADRAVVGQLPSLHRLHAAWCRAVPRRRDGTIPGGSFLLRAIARLVRLFRLADTAMVAGPAGALVLDRLDPRMLQALGELLDGGAEAAALAARLRPGDTFVDVGANHGAFAVRAARLVGTAGRVIAIEPQARLAGLLERALAATGGAPFRVHAVACGEGASTAELFVPAAGSGSAGLFPGFSARGGHRRETVEVRSLDDLLAGDDLPGRMLLKLDAEGAETAILRGARRLVARRRPALLLELNADSAAAAGSSLAGLTALLAELGYRRWAEIERLDDLRPLAELTDPRQRNVWVEGGATLARPAAPG